MAKGWKATGLLQPLWKRYEGGRDALARKVGTTPTVLSSINTGNRSLGYDLAGRLAEELKVSVLELGAPLAEADGEGLTLRDRLEELATDLAASMEEQARLNRKIQTLQARVRKLEVRPEQPGGAATGRAR